MLHKKEITFSIESPSLPIGSYNPRPGPYRVIGKTNPVSMTSTISYTQYFQKHASLFHLAVVI
jgi:hypothetical protein